MLCARSTATPSSSKMDELVFSFSLSLADSLGLFDDGVGISSTEVAGEATQAPSTLGIIGVASMADGPFPVTRTTFLPMLAKGSSFLALILAYMSLLNLVVISKKKKKKEREKS